jgi:hypothetical protein
LPEGVIETGTAFVADAETAKLFQPAQRAFDKPAEAARTTAVGPAAVTDDGLDVSFAKLVLVGRRR